MSSTKCRSRIPEMLDAYQLVSFASYRTKGLQSAGLVVAATASQAGHTYCCGRMRSAAVKYLRA